MNNFIGVLKPFIICGVVNIQQDKNNGIKIFSLVQLKKIFIRVFQIFFFSFQNDTMRIVWAFHKDEPSGGAVGPKSLPQHDQGSRGSQSLYLVQRADQDGPGPEETARIWELRNPAVDAPAPGETLYWCRVFRIPTITRKHHLIRVSVWLGRHTKKTLVLDVLFVFLEGLRVRSLIFPVWSPLTKKRPWKFEFKNKFRLNIWIIYLKITYEAYSKNKGNIG